MPRHVKGLLAVLNLLVVWLVFNSAAAAQSGASSITGTVKDQSGGVVAGATVTLTNVETNAVRTAESSSSGAFGFEIVPVGDYEVTVEATGFRKSVIRPVRAQVSNVTEVPVILELGQMSSTGAGRVGRRGGSGEYRRLDAGKQFHQHANHAVAD